MSWGKNSDLSKMSRLKRSLYCKEYPDHCVKPKDMVAFCSAFPQYCQSSTENLMFPKPEIVRELKATSDQAKKLGFTFDDSIIDCVFWNGSDVEECSEVEEPLVLPIYHIDGIQNCHTVFSQIRNKIGDVEISKGFGLFLRLDFDYAAEEYIHPDAEVLAIVDIHNPYELRNPFIYGTRIEPGRDYVFHVRIKEESLLPSPYESSCTDYEALRKSRGGKGPRTLEGCYSECVHNQSTSAMGCRCIYNLYMSNISYCEENYKTDELCSNAFTSCWNKCAQACSYITYDFKVTHEDRLDTNYTTLEELYDDVSIPREHEESTIVFKMDPKVLLYEHNPEFNNYQIFGDIGGFIGIWLGMSLIAVFDFLETMFLVIKFWIIKHCYKRQTQRLETPNTKDETTACMAV